MSEKQIADLETDGYFYFNSILKDEIDLLIADFLEISGKKLNKKISDLSQIHLYLSPDEVNNFRLDLIKSLNKNINFRNSLKEKCSPLFKNLLGPDLVIQKNFNLVLSLPNDSFSQIPLHSDVWTGHSPYELNMWIPLTKVEGEMSMFILPLSKWRAEKNKINFTQTTISDLQKKFEKDWHYVNMKPGGVFVFWHHLPHGNHTHHTENTRWSLNIRTKNLFSPYGEKNFGEYFEPWTMSSLSKIVLEEGNFYP